MSKQRDVKSRVADAALKQMLRAADPGREYTSTEIASATGLSRQRINQIEQQALRKIRTFGGKTNPLRTHPRAAQEMKLDHPLQAWAKKARGGHEFHQTILDLTLRCPELFPSPEAAARYCAAASDNFNRRALQPNEVQNALSGAYAKQHEDPSSPKPPKLQPSPQLIQTHRGREGDLDALRISSDLTVRTAGQALAKLYHPSDWICLSKSVSRPEFDFVGNWVKKPDLSEYQFIVPSVYGQGCLSKALGRHPEDLLLGA